MAAGLYVTCRDETEEHGLSRFDWCGPRFVGGVKEHTSHARATLGLIRHACKKALPAHKTMCNM